MSTISAHRLAQVAIIGRPNVGKSTLFNLLTESRKAVVKDEPGVTRDLLIEEAELWGKRYELIDTGGLTEATDTFSPLIREQVLSFISTVDFLVVVMDGRSGLVPEDRDLVRIASESGRPFVVVVNKVDKPADLEIAKSEFYEFGVEVMATSFEHRHGLSDLLEWLHERLPDVQHEATEGLRLSVVGKPNAGKSSLVNKLVGQNRVLVSDVAGTTVDSVDVAFQYKDRTYTLVDTAGLRRSARREEDVEIISAFKSQEAIRRSDLILLVIDACQGPTDQDAKIVELALNHHKAVLIVANKVDLAEEQIEGHRSWFRARMAQVFHFFSDLEVAFISAKTGRGLEKLMEKIEDMESKLGIRISTSELNDFFFQVIRQAPSPVMGTKSVKFFYLTQTRQVPPSFIAFANYPEAVDNSYRRFLMKRIKERWNLQGIPVRIFVMKSGKRTEPA